jgi:hypothetical protein
MAAMAHAGIVGIFFPEPRPMHVDIDVVTIDHDPFNAEIHHDVLERFKITLGLLLKPVGCIHRNHQRGQAGGILADVCLAQRLDRFVDAKVPLVIFRILNGLPTASRRGKPPQDGNCQRSADRF